MNEKYYREQIEGLYLILSKGDEPTVHRSYVKEKLRMILHKGINFHPSIIRHLKELEKK